MSYYSLNSRKKRGTACQRLNMQALRKLLEKDV